jgi:hypothetical protein
MEISGEETPNVLDRNRGGRKILHDCSFPLALWPLVLHRAIQVYIYYDKEDNNREVNLKCESPQLSVLYSLLRDNQCSFLGFTLGRRVRHHRRGGSKYK